MKIEAVDFFYLSMPEVRDIGDGSQDALLVRVAAGGLVGWGECEASPLASIAAWNCPMSHSACKPVSASVLGQPIDSPDDIRRINALVRANSLDLLQADHTLSGIDVALWDLLGKRLGQPVYRLLGYDRAHPKLAYASVLFGQTPELTFAKARTQRQAGYRAVKFGWGPFGRGSVEDDAGQLHAAREGLGDDGVLLVDAGTVWGDDVQYARQRLPALQACRAQWLEEPFVSGALESYRQLAGEANGLRMAGGEGCHSFYQAKNMIDYAGLGYIQIDAGRIGGITPAHQAAEYARAKGVQFVNHTFTTHLALSASLQPYAGSAADDLSEYPAEPSPLASDLSCGALQPDGDGYVHVPDGGGLGVEPNLGAVRRYLVDAEIRVSGRIVYRTPEI
ncbi:MAG: mandelate racemase/muconate lactonizing enzyme family protein [Pirellulales bacterium]|nr:mandelate racemase/muconate lactonizing enzyme family protein [Pirellulales bacterium]